MQRKITSLNYTSSLIRHKLLLRILVVVKQLVDITLHRKKPRTTPSRTERLARIHSPPTPSPLSDSAFPPVAATGAWSFSLGGAFTQVKIPPRRPSIWTSGCSSPLILGPGLVLDLVGSKTKNAFAPFKSEVILGDSRTNVLIRCITGSRCFY